MKEDWLTKNTAQDVEDNGIMKVESNNRKEIFSESFFLLLTKFPIHFWIFHRRKQEAKNI